MAGLGDSTRMPKEFAEQMEADLGVDPDFELVLAVGEVHDLVEGHLRAVPLIGLPHQLLQLLLLFLSRSQLAS